jgi:NAD(P)-dependent dehydrogenase (short-subunit alcohol dehydrogenase family)
MITPLVLGLDEELARFIAASIDGELLVQPHLDAQPNVDDDSVDWQWADPLEFWRALANDGPKADQIVVALFPEVSEPTSLETVGLIGWVERFEVALARWIAALGVAQQRCADGGSITAIVDRVAPLDSAGRSAETSVSDAVEALVRSLARSEGGRGVRVNLVTTPARLTRLPVVDPQPPLKSFPGSIKDQVISTCRMLLSDDASALTSTVIHADSGRSWR